MTERVTRFSRLVITVPRWIAEPYGAALVELGAGAVEDCSRAPAEEIGLGEIAPGEIAPGEIALGERNPMDAAEHDELGRDPSDTAAQRGRDPSDTAAQRGRDPSDTAAQRGRGVALAELRVSVPSEESIESWESVASSLYEAFAESLSLPRDAFSLHTEVVDFDYHAAWLEHLTPQRLTDRLWITPSARASDVPTDAQRLVFEPHPSFGDGSHPTTRLAAQAVESFCLRHPNCSVLDVGTGNGVLSLVAAASGATCVGVDIDGDAVVAARHNAERNALEGRCRFETTPLSLVDGHFDLVVANVEPLTQLELGAQWPQLVSTEGRLVLTGFLVEQIAMVAAPLHRLGFRTTREAEAEGYALVEFEFEGHAGVKS